MGKEYGGYIKGTEENAGRNKAGTEEKKSGDGGEKSGDE
jgi:hypothetical protein